jgi:hypothetical protein
VNGTFVFVYSPEGKVQKRVPVPKCDRIEPSPDGRLMAVLEHASGRMTLFETQNFTEVGSAQINETLNIAASNTIGELTWSPDSKYLAAANNYGGATVWSITWKTPE